MGKKFLKSNNSVGPNNHVGGKTLNLNNHVGGTNIHYRSVAGGWAGWAIAHPVFGRIEGAARQRYRAALLLAHPVLNSNLSTPLF